RVSAAGWTARDIFWGGARREYRPYRSGGNQALFARLRGHFRRQEEKERQAQGQEEGRQAGQEKGQEVGKPLCRLRFRVPSQFPPAAPAAASVEKHEPFQHFHRINWQRCRGTLFSLFRLSRRGTPHPVSARDSRGVWSVGAPVRGRALRLLAPLPG